MGKVIRKKNNRMPMLLLGGGLIILSGIMVSVIFAPFWKTNLNSVEVSRSSVVPLKVSYPAPDLSLENVNGGFEALGDFQGQIILINNWATWCPPCKAEMPTLVDYYDAHSDEGLKVVAIDAGEPKDQVLQYVEEFNLPFNVWLDPNNLAMNAFKNQNLPSSYVVDGSGMVRFAWTGEINREMLEEFITPLLSE
jgi:thiol-disulfide isomerase/thioredoxin